MNGSPPGLAHNGSAITRATRNKSRPSLKDRTVEVHLANNVLVVTYGIRGTPDCPHSTRRTCTALMRGMRSTELVPVLLVRAMARSLVISISNSFQTA